MRTGLNEFLYGATCMACLVAGLFFFRFWRKTSDRLFLMFGIAFLLLGGQWAALAFTDEGSARAPIYAVRLVAFGLIVAGVVAKNRKP